MPGDLLLLSCVKLTLELKKWKTFHAYGGTISLLEMNSETAVKCFRGKRILSQFNQFRKNGILIWTPIARIYFRLESWINHWFNPHFLPSHEVTPNSITWKVGGSSEDSALLGFILQRPFHSPLWGSLLWVWLDLHVTRASRTVGHNPCTFHGCQVVGAQQGGRSFAMFISRRFNKDSSQCFEI